MHLENFSPALWLEAVAQAQCTPDALDQLGNAYTQHRKYLPPRAQKELDACLLASNLRDQVDHAASWVKWVFLALGTAGLEPLSQFAKDNRAPEPARELARQKVVLLNLENELPLPTATQSSGLWQGWKTAPQLSPEKLTASLVENSKNRVQEARQAGYAPLAACDCDGTLWHADIGDAFFLRALAQRWLKPDAAGVLKVLCDTYKLSFFPDVHDTAAAMLQSREDGSFLRNAESIGVAKNLTYRHFYGTQAQAMAGMSLGFIKARMHEIMSEAGGIAGRIFPEISNLLQRAEECGLLVVPISASHHVLVEAAVPFLGIPARRSLGVRTPIEQGTLGHALLEPMAYGPGKHEMMVHLAGRPPALAIGDSWQRTDKELLEGAGLGLVVDHGARAGDMDEQLLSLLTQIPKA